MGGGGRHATVVAVVVIFAVSKVVHLVCREDGCGGDGHAGLRRDGLGWGFLPAHRARGPPFSPPLPGRAPGRGDPWRLVAMDGAGRACPLPCCTVPWKQEGGW